MHQEDFKRLRLGQVCHRFNPRERVKFITFADKDSTLGIFELASSKSQVALEASDLRPLLRLTEKQLAALDYGRKIRNYRGQATMLRGLANRYPDDDFLQEAATHFEQYVIARYPGHCPKCNKPNKRCYNAYCDDCWRTL